MKGERKRGNISTRLPLPLKSFFLSGVFFFLQCHCEPAALRALRTWMTDFLHVKSHGGWVQSVQVCSRQHHFLPYCWERVRATHSDRGFYHTHSPRTAMQRNSNGVIQSICLSQWSVRLAEVIQTDGTRCNSVNKENPIENARRRLCVRGTYVWMAICLFVFLFRS